MQKYQKNAMAGETNTTDNISIMIHLLASAVDVL